MQRKKSCLYYWWIRIFHITLSVAIVAGLLVVDSELKQNLFDVIGNGIFVAVAYLSLFALALAMYIWACTADPGYVEIIDTDDKDDESDVDSNQNSCSENSSMIAGVQLRHCGFCDIKQPLRSRHCEDCGRCVRRYDHHCPWLNTCIGELNHKYFLIFLTLECCLVIWTSVIVLHSVKHETDWSSWFMANATYLVVGCVLVAGGLPSIFLCAFHSYLMCSGQTTWEVVSRERISYLKNRAWDFYPFDEGCVRNSSRFLCQCTAHKWEVVYTKVAASDKSSAA